PRTTAIIDASGARALFTVGTPILAAQINVDPALLQPVPFPAVLEAPLAGAPQPIDVSLLALSILVSEGVGTGKVDLGLYGGGLALTHTFSSGVTGTAWLRYNHLRISSDS